MLRTSWLTRRFEQALQTATVQELAQLVLPGKNLQFPQALLLTELQRRLDQRLLRLMEKTLAHFEKPSELLLHFFRRYEYDNIKLLFRSSKAGKKLDQQWNLGQWASPGMVKLESIEQCTGNFSWASTIDSNLPEYRIEFEIDRHYLERTIALVKKLPMHNRNSLMSLLQAEVKCELIVWVLRLRCYYTKSDEEIKELLKDVVLASKGDFLGRLLGILDENHGSWKNWSWAWAFSDQNGNPMEKIDPVGVEINLNAYLVKRYWHHVHRLPLTEATVYAFFRLLEAETRVLKGLLEAKSMGLQTEEIARMLGGSLVR